MLRRSWGVIVVVGLLTWAAMPLGAWGEPRPDLSVGPRTALPGARIEVSGTGFGPIEAVDVFLDTRDLAMVITDDEGTFRSEVRIPDDTAPAEHWISALGRRSGDLSRARIEVRGTASWPQRSFDGARTSWNPDERALRARTVTNMELGWQAKLAGSGYVEHLVASDDTIYAAGFGAPSEESWDQGSSTLQAIDQSSGTVRWSRSFGRSWISGLALTERVLIGTIDGRTMGSIAAIDPETGATRWSRELVTGRAADTGEVVLDAKAAYVAASSAQGWAIQAVALETGDTLWSVDLQRGWVASLAIDDGILVAATQDGVNAYDAATGDKRWRVAGQGFETSYVAIADGRVICQLADKDGPALVALDLAGGHRLWSTPWEWLWLHGVVAHGDQLLVSTSYWESSNGELWSVDPDTGQTRWTRRGQFWGDLIGAGDVVFSGGSFGVTAYDARTGKELMRNEAADLAFAAVNGTLLASDNEAGLVVQAFAPPTPPAPAVERLVPDASLQPDVDLEGQDALTDGWTQLPIDLPAGDLAIAGVTTFEGDAFVGTTGTDGGGLFVVREDRLQRIGTPGLGDADTTTLRPLAIGGALYVVGANERTGLKLLSSTDGRSFSVLTDDGLGDPSNVDAIPMNVRGTLTLGVTNPRTGGQLWTIQDYPRRSFGKVIGVPTTRVDGFTGPVEFRGATYVGTTGVGTTSLLRTTDAVTWTQVPVTDAAATTAVTPQPVAGNTLFVVAASPAGMGLYTSEDGESFEPGGPTGALPQDAAVDAQVIGFGDARYLVASSLDPRATIDGATIEVAPEQPFLVWRTTDDRTWSPVDGLPTDPHNVAARAFVAGDALYLAVDNFEEGDAVYRTVDEMTWTAIFREASGSHTSTGIEPVVSSDRLTIVPGDTTHGMTAWRADEPLGAGAASDWLLPVALITLAITAGAVAFLVRRGRTPPPAPKSPAVPRAREEALVAG